MFQHSGSRGRSTASLIFTFLEVTYHSTARKVRKNHGNAVLSIGLSILQGIVFIAAFYLMFSVMGAQSSAIRGNFLVYLMSGIFLYLTHIQAVQQIMRADGPTSSMMQHAPMNTMVSIASTALSVLYIQTCSLLCILLLIHVMIEPVHIHNWEGALRMYLLAWGTGVVIGIAFMAMRPWAPDVVGMIATIYVRANMIFSGKMFVANSMPSLLLPMFSWNPLFHVIDQTRGHVFVNYFPHVTNGYFPAYFTLAALLVAMMLEHRTRRQASASWGAKR